MTRPPSPSVLLVGNPEPTHVGGHLLAGARRAGVPMRLCDAREAYEGPAWRRHVAWWARGHRPAKLLEFGRTVVAAARDWPPGILLATGLAPLDRSALDALGELGVVRINFLTDDPWNPAHRAPWFIDALARYDHVFSPRRANLGDLEALTGPAVSYLPFAYNPDEHYPAEALDATERARYDADVAFAGGADEDRVAVMATLANAGLALGLYGGYWDRHVATRAAARGHVDAAGLRKAIAGARVALCLVRRANRDEHAMRTYEVAAMGGCMLVERTTEHEALFGPDGEAVRYFSTPEEAAGRARALLADADERARLSRAVRQLVTAGAHTYADRLATMLARAAGDVHEDRAGHPGTLSRV